jgi:uncharacterized protein YukE
MNESEIFANPQKIQGLAEELRTFAANLSSELEAMNSGFHALGATWRDQDYEKFKRSFERLREEIQKLGEEINRREPELKEDAQSLIAYLNKNI